MAFGFWFCCRSSAAISVRENNGTFISTLHLLLYNVSIKHSRMTWTKLISALCRYKLDQQSEVQKHLHYLLFPSHSSCEWDVFHLYVPLSFLFVCTCCLVFIWLVFEDTQSFSPVFIQFLSLQFWLSGCSAT